MAISIICINKDPLPIARALEALDDSLDVRIWPDDGDKSEVTMALCWRHPAGVLADYQNLRCICSLGAGVDHLFNDADLPKHLPVVRLVDETLAAQMYEYVLASIMSHLRSFTQFAAQQRQRNWLQHQAKSIAEVKVGIMGLGQLGATVAKRLADVGFTVLGWARSAKDIVGVECFSGNGSQYEFLSQSDILVNLLPLTTQTENILNHELFAKLPKGAYVINVGRGHHLVDENLISSIDSGQLAGACLDVFRTEPLPSNHPFWQHAFITITPHCSSLTCPKSVAPQIIENYRRLSNAAPLINVVDTALGY